MGKHEYLGTFYQEPKLGASPWMRYFKLREVSFPALMPRWSGPGQLGKIGKILRTDICKDNFIKLRLMWCYLHNMARLQIISLQHLFKVKLKQLCPCRQGVTKIFITIIWFWVVRGWWIVWRLCNIGLIANVSVLYNDNLFFAGTEPNQFMLNIMWQDRVHEF